MRTTSEIWDDAVVFMRRERALIVPVALATGPWNEILKPLIPGDSNGTPQGAGMLVAPVCALIGIFGQLAITALTLQAGISVGEALRIARRRLPTVIGMGFIVAAALLVLVLPIVLILMKSGYDVTAAGGVERMPAAAALAILVVAMVFAYVLIRLVLANSVVIDTTLGPMMALRRSWAMTRGHAWRLLGLVLLYVVMLLVITGAVRAVIGSVVLALARASNALVAGQVIVGVVVGIVSALLAMMFTVVVARYYQAVSNGT